MIDWTKPIETVPCKRNPVPVRCELVGGFKDSRIVRICGDYKDAGGVDLGDTGWSYDEDGTVGNDWLPDLRNVATEEPNTVTMGLTREMHRALVDAGYADLGDYVARWGDGE